MDSISLKLEIQIAFIENIDLFANVGESQIGSYLLTKGLSPVFPFVERSDKILKNNACISICVCLTLPLSCL